jgi:RNA polymerase sigma-70 factor (ECF subfamily)
MIANPRQQLLDRAKAGDGPALGELLDGYRPYLAVIARARGAARVQSKAGESDLVQDALLEAHRSFANFRGESIEELSAWLRQIAIRTTGHVLRDHLDAAKRDANREETIAGRSDMLVADGSTPSGKAMKHEAAAQMAQTLARLPEDMQTVLLGRHVDETSYADLALRLGRSEGAVRVLYTRALRRLREECSEPKSGG